MLYFAGESTQTSSQYRSCLTGAWLSGLEAGENMIKTLYNNNNNNINIPIIIPTASVYKS